MIIKTKAKKVIITNFHSDIIKFTSRNGKSVIINGFKIRYLTITELPQELQIKLEKHKFFTNTKKDSQDAVKDTNWIGASYIVPKKLIKTSVERNYIKRLLRNTITQHANQIPSHIFITFILLDNKNINCASIQSILNDTSMAKELAFKL